MVSTTVSTKIVVGFDDHFTQSAKKALESYKKTLEEVRQLEEKPITLHFISQDISKQFREIKGLISSFEGQNQLFIHLNLIDEATENAIKVRKKLEEIFKRAITQIINIKKVSSKGFNDRDFDQDREDPSGPTGIDDSRSIDGSSINPGGFDTFGSIKGFSTGIDRVPRNMLAVIHKDESVLTKTEAEERRRGTSSGMAIQSVNINMNIPDSFSLSSISRQNFRQFALQMQDELRRLDRRMSR